MASEDRLRLADVFVSISDPRQIGKVAHGLVELLVVAVNAVLVGADTFVEIELWAKEKQDWLRRYLRLERGIPSHDTFGRLFGLIDPGQFESAFRQWVSGVIPALGADVVAIDGKTSRRSGGGGRHRSASGFRLCRRSRTGDWATGHGGKIQREDGHSRVTFNSGAGGLHGHQRQLPSRTHRSGLTSLPHTIDGCALVRFRLRLFFM